MMYWNGGGDAGPVRQMCSHEPMGSPLALQLGLALYIVWLSAPSLPGSCALDTTPPAYTWSCLQLPWSLTPGSAFCPGGLHTQVQQSAPERYWGLCLEYFFGVAWYRLGVAA